MESEESVDTGFESLQNHHDGITVDTSDPQKPNLILSADEHRRLGEPFAQILVVQMVGRSISLASMKRILPRLWGKKGKVSVSDVANGYFMVGFKEMNDYMLALTGGPWTIADSYLNVTSWRPDFDLMTEEITKVAVWVRLPGISLKYFDKKFLWNVGNLLGKVIKVDMSTAMRARGMFARLCVEIDLTKPLVPHYAIDGETMKIEYESMGLLCLACGRFGHMKGECKEKGEVPEEGKADEQTGMDIPKQSTNEGPWCVVQKNRRGRRLQGRETMVQETSRFAILEHEEDTLKEPDCRIFPRVNKEVNQRQFRNEKGAHKVIKQGVLTKDATRDQQFVFKAGGQDTGVEKARLKNTGRIVIRRDEEISTDWKEQRLNGLSPEHIQQMEYEETTSVSDRMFVENVDRNHVIEDAGGTLMAIETGRDVGLEADNHEACLVD